jgi:transposase
MAKIGKRYFTAEFKREAVALWEASGRTQTEVAGELGIMPTMLRRWQRGIGVGAAQSAAQLPTSMMASPADQASEIAKLRRELDRTRMERDILKKAVGIFAEMPR